MPVIITGTYPVATVQMISMAEQAMEQQVLARALSQRAVASADAAVVRDLFATDLNATLDKFIVNASTSWGYVYSGTLTDKKVIGIFAVANPVFENMGGLAFGSGFPLGGDDSSGKYLGLHAPNGLSAVKFLLGAGAQVKDIWNLQGKGIERGAVVLAKAPVIYNKNETWRIDAIAQASGANPVFFGKVCEPKGEKISPD